ncbi:alpha/beta hydrolase [Sulfuriferula nivalis]|uniref:AB hydrolase-1 domain-containing protein n=1 Tax=Sulfuriferula nivalis TaxID=2675298 RepID=A0A809SI25_9PROT|nr:alpha/beta fold hydrolase [Sulfuriferula nivalis]BBP01340.1 hypothetical protein SFSGTM_20480 [Sulfuriferula nivalis]
MAFRSILLAWCLMWFGSLAHAQSPQLGIVIMHGKGGSPSGLVSTLAEGLQTRGYLVSNLDMPWSGRRHYDVDVAHAQREVEAAILSLRQQGAQKVFVAGHSQGGVFAMYLAGVLPVDGVIAMSPGGNVASAGFREKLGETVAQARQLQATGQGDVTVGLNDYEGSRGLFTVITTPNIYLSWFDPEGAMNLEYSVLAAKVPILWTVAKNDYPALRQVNIPLYSKLPANPSNHYYESDSDHKGAPTADMDEIVRWTHELK